ncbi:MAG: glycine/betaine ABC transporter substrate-binding protein [Firmicutes bacterium]|nr:glycine/betaine ABC transporter substrate-binding protein [Bacillota bacterium]
MIKLRWLAVAVCLGLLIFGVVGCGGGGSSQNDAGESESEIVIENWVFAADHEFAVRPDGLPKLEEEYGFKFDDVMVMDLGVTYGALKEEQVAVAMGFATDGRIGAFNLVNLEDDKKFFPVYNPAPVVRKEIMDKSPEIKDILEPIAEKLDTDTMIALNGKVDVDGMQPKEAAEEFLNDNGLLGEAVEASKGKVVVGSKEFTEQLILGQITILALQNAGFEVEDSTGLGGTEVARSALENGEIDMYWEYTGTGWLVALEHEEAITDSDEAYQKVKEEDLENNNLVWLPYAPFNNTYTIMMRGVDAEALGIKSISDLAAQISS